MLISWTRPLTPLTLIVFIGSIYLLQQLTETKRLDKQREGTAVENKRDKQASKLFGLPGRRFRRQQASGSSGEISSGSSIKEDKLRSQPSAMPSKRPSNNLSASGIQEQQTRKRFKSSLSRASNQLQARSFQLDLDNTINTDDRNNNNDQLYNYALSNDLNNNNSSISSLSNINQGSQTGWRSRNVDSINGTVDLSKYAQDDVDRLYNDALLVYVKNFNDSLPTRREMISVNGTSTNGIPIYHSLAGYSRLRSR